MADIADKIDALTTATAMNGNKLDSILTAVQSIGVPVVPPVDLTPVLTAIAAVGAKLEPTPAATPDAPAA